MLYWVALLLMVAFFSGFVIAVRLIVKTDDGAYTFLSASSKQGMYFDNALYSDVVKLLKQNYVHSEKIDDKELFYGALKGLVAALDDPYTSFFNPVAYEEFDRELQGSFDGIGAELGIKDDRLTIIAPIVGSPAEKAGLRAGDIIVAIDKKDTGGISLDEAVSLIRGKADTTVALTIFHDTNGGPSLDIAVKRATITLPTVKLTVTDNAIAIINLYSFNSESESQMIDTVRSLQDTQVRGIILDLRNNPGGFLDKAVNIASAWLKPGDVVVREVYQNAHTSKEYTAIQQIPVPDVQTIILVNRGSASAAEILAGALQDYGKATLVGETTYGKGSVQELKTLTDGSALKVTVSQWLTPKGRYINDEGIAPDVVVEMTAEDYAINYDPQLEKAKELINQSK